MLNLLYLAVEWLLRVSTGTSDHDTAYSVSPYERHTGTVFI